jgi:trehalose-phosphatase
VVPLLQAIAAAGGSEVAVFSGRPLRELIRFLGTPPIHLVGEHGWETRYPDGRMAQHPLQRGCEEALRNAIAAAETVGLAPFLERKRTAVVLHTRGIPGPQALEVERLCLLQWKKLAMEPHLRISPANGGLELRAMGRDKGTALRELLDNSDPGTFAVYIGDDSTDEDAFRELRNRGLGIRIGPTEQPSLARGRIESCDAMKEFLQRWRAILDEGPANAVNRHE